MLVTQSSQTHVDPTDCSPPGSSVHGILQARIQEWVAILFSRGSSQPRDQTWVSCIAGILYHLSHQGSPKMPLLRLIFKLAYWLNWPPNNKTVTKHLAACINTKIIMKHISITKFLLLKNYFSISLGQFFLSLCCLRLLIVFVVHPVLFTDQYILVWMGAEFSLDGPHITW